MLQPQNSCLWAYKDGAMTTNAAIYCAVVALQRYVHLFSAVPISPDPSLASRHVSPADPTLPEILDCHG